MNSKTTAIYKTKTFKNLQECLTKKCKINKKYFNAIKDFQKHHKSKNKIGMLNSLKRVMKYSKDRKKLECQYSKCKKESIEHTIKTFNLHLKHLKQMEKIIPMLQSTK